MTITIWQLVNLIQRSYPYPWVKNRDIVLNWLSWYIRKGLAICLTDDGKKVCGLALVRPVMEAEDGLKDYQYDPEGPVIHCDFLYAKHNEAMRGIYVDAIKRFGARRKTVSWQRRGTLRVYPAQKIVLKMLKEKEVCEQTIRS